MTARPVIACLLAIALSMLSGCVSKESANAPGGIGPVATPRARQIEPEARSLFFQAERAYTAKNYEQATRLYQMVKNRFPKGRAHMLSSYRLGSIHYYQEEYADAAREFDYFLARFPASELSFDVTYNLAAAQYQLGDYERASRTLSRLKASEVQAQGPRRAEVVYQLTAQVAGALGDHASVVAAYAAESQLPLEAGTRATLEENIDSHLSRIGSRTDLERLLAEVTEPNTRAKIQERLASLEPSAALAPIAGGPPGANGQPESPAPLEGNGEPGDRMAVGVILPLTGKFAVYGHRALEGIMLGAQMYSASRDLDLRIYVEDSAGNPAQAQQAVDTLYHQHHVMAIIGPLGWKESKSVADRAQSLGILNLSLTPKEGISEGGQYLFQNALTPRVQLDNLVRYCVNEKKFHRFAILAPNNAYGKDLTNEFWDIVEKYGARIVGYETYPPGEKDFQKEVQQLTGLGNSKFRRYEAGKLAEYVVAQKAKTHRDPKARMPPVVDFDALFIPDSPKTGAAIAANMAYFDAGGVAWLGTTEWNTEQLYQSGGRAVEGAIFPGGVSPSTRNPKQRDFIKLYTEAYGNTPELLSTEAYEALELVSAALKKTGSGDRAELANAMASLHEFETPLGNLTFDQTRIAQRKIPIFHLESGGNIVQD